MKNLLGSPVVLLVVGNFGPIGGAYFKGRRLFYAITMGFIFSIVRWIIFFPIKNRFFETLGQTGICPLVLTPFFSFFHPHPNGSHGLNWIFFLMAVNYAGDTGAYYAGRTLGRHKLAPMISPQKTIEGSIGGLAANILVAWIFQRTLFSPYSFLQMASLGLTIGVVSQVGDL